jgi:RimJ/RimL family protein N-acetyltransferase
MRASVGAWVLDGFHFFSVIEKSTGNWIGRVGPMYPHDWPGPEVGWGLLSTYWGKGYAREAATRAINFAFDNLGWNRVLHLIHPENIRSQALAKALGSHCVGPGRMPDPYSQIPVDIWSQSKEEWNGRRG